jgi:hypothetical protein
MFCPQLKRALDFFGNNLVMLKNQHFLGDKFVAGSLMLRVCSKIFKLDFTSPVACPNTKGVSESDLTNLLVGLMQVRISK